MDRVKQGTSCKRFRYNGLRVITVQVKRVTCCKRFGYVGLRVVNGSDATGYGLKLLGITRFLKGLNGFGLKRVGLLLGSNPITSGRFRFGL